MHRDSSMHAEAHGGYSFTKCPNGEIIVRDHYHSQLYIVPVSKTVAPSRGAQMASLSSSSSSRMDRPMPTNQAGPSRMNSAIPSPSSTPVAPSIQQSLSTLNTPPIPHQQASRTPPAQPSYTSRSTLPTPNHSLPPGLPNHPLHPRQAGTEHRHQGGQPHPQPVNGWQPRNTPPGQLSRPAGPSTQPQRAPSQETTVSSVQNTAARSRDDANMSISAPPPSSRTLPRTSSLSVAPRKSTLAQDLLRALRPKRGRSVDDEDGPATKVQVVERDGRPEPRPASVVNDPSSAEVQSRPATTVQVVDMPEPRPASAPAVNTSGSSSFTPLAPAEPPGYRPFNQTTMYADPRVQAAVAVNLRPPPDLSSPSVAQPLQMQVMEATPLDPKGKGKGPMAITSNKTPDGLQTGNGNVPATSAFQANAVASSSKVTTDAFAFEQPGDDNDSNLPVNETSRSTSVQEAPLFLPSSPRSSAVSVDKIPPESSDGEDDGEKENATDGGDESNQFGGRTFRNVSVEIPPPPDWVREHLERIREEAEVEKSKFICI